MEKKIQIPYRLSFNGHKENGLPKFKPGRGEAGWTVAEFNDSASALAFMDAYREAEMPCWKMLHNDLSACGK